MRRVLITGAQVPFVNGGAELLNQGLLKAIKEHYIDVEIDLVQLPYTWYPEHKLLENLAAWRMIDITEVSGKKVDLVIGTKFPSYAINHTNKVLWLVHQYRQMYDLRGTSFDNSNNDESSDRLRSKLFDLDSRYLSESKKITTISQNVSDRLLKFNGFDSTVIMPPSNFSKSIRVGEYGDYLICLGRIDHLKRPLLLLESLKEVKQAKVKFIGTGDRDLIQVMRDFININGLADRVEMLGYVDEATLVKNLADARGVFYAPVDEDFGFATIEAMLARKNVITCFDSGEVASIVNKTGAGWVCSPGTVSIAKAISELFNESDLGLYERSKDGFLFASNISWTNVLNELVEPYL